MKIVSSDTTLISSLFKMDSFNLLCSKENIDLGIKFGLIDSNQAGTLRYFVDSILHFTYHKNIKKFRADSVNIRSSVLTIKNLII